MTNARYRIQAVSEMTGIPAATLRAWERRYGVPNPSRTNSSYRLYSHEDVAKIKLIKELCDQGLAPSEAVKMIQNQTSLFVDYPPVPQESSVPSSLLSIDASAFEHSREMILSAIHSFNPIALEQHVRKALILGSAKQIFDSVFAPVMKIVGEKWHSGHLSIAQEHLATEVVGNATRDLLRMMQPERHSKQILMACIQEEYHALPLYGSALHFMQWGYRVVLLGVNTPPTALAQSIQSLKPEAVGLSITQIPSREKAELLLPIYANICKDLTWMVGGSGAYALRELIEELGGMVAVGNPESIRLKFDARMMNM